LIDHQGNQVKKKKAWKKKKELEGRAPIVCGGLFLSTVPSSTLYAYTCYSHSILPVHWAYRVFSGPWGLVVVRANWPRHPTLIKKKLKKKWENNEFLKRMATKKSRESWILIDG
jgi:hypothetical protein